MRYLQLSLIVFAIIGNLLVADNKAASAAESAQRVIDVLEHKTFQHHISTDIFNIAHNGHLLPETEKEKLKSLGFDFSGEKVVMKSSMMQDYYDTEHFRFHYDIDGWNSVDPTDNDNDGVPDYVNIMANTFEDVYHHDINELGYTPPPSDGSHGGSPHFDVYIKKLSYYGLTNYISPAVGDNPNSPLVKENNAYASYLNMNSSYEGASFAHNTELENIQVTAAHEFFHAIQLGYDGDEQLWLLEATAVWMEEEHYDDVNDCYQYLIPWFDEPHINLTKNYSLHPYGSFILFKYIDEHFGGENVIRKTWEYSRLYDGLVDDYSLQCVDLALNEQGYTFKQALNNMVIANSILSSDASAGIYAYEEADGYQNHQEISYGDTIGIVLGLLDSVQFNKDDFFTIYSNRLLQPYASQYVRIETDDPVKVTLHKSDYNETPINGLSMHSIVKTTNGNYSINSGQTLNIDPSTNTEWIYVAVVSNEEIPESVFNYQLNLSNGTAEYIENFTITSYYPNPFNSTTNIKVKVSTPQKIDINVYDLLGRKVKSISSKYLSDGTHEFKWDGTLDNNSSASSGVYYITAKSNIYQEWKKVTLVK